jgi:basic amino acid/polyamine antiporter, APA family
VVGGTIRASIFLVPSIMAQSVPYLGGALATWVLGAAIAVCSALTVSELATTLPQAGGGYVYIRAALGPWLGFLFAWTDAVLIRVGAAAAISFTFGYLLRAALATPGQPSRRCAPVLDRSSAKADPRQVRSADAAPD